MSTNDGGRRPTKAERKEQARREREELQRSAARRTRVRATLIGVGAAALAAAVLVWFLFLRPEPVDVPDPGVLASQAAGAIERAGCDPAENVGPYDPEANDATHIGDQLPEMPPLSTYPSTPPASGPHNAVPLPAGVYDSPPPIDQVIHSLEHGGVVVWYSPDASGPQVDEIKAYFDQDANAEKMIVAPFDYPDESEAGSLPPGVGMSMVAWHTVQQCEDPSLAVAAAFVDDYRAVESNEDYKGEAPEPFSSM